MRSRLLEAALAVAGDGPVRQETLAEQAFDLARDGQEAEAEALARSVLAEADPRAHVARGRALLALGRLDAFRATPEALRRAEESLEEAAGRFALAGEDEWRAHALMALGYRVHFTLGDLERAIQRTREALDLTPEPGRERAVVLAFVAELPAYVGRPDESRALLDELGGIARTLGDRRLLAYAAWIEARVAAQAGQHATTLEQLRLAENQHGDWFEHQTGTEFLADAALLLAGLGDEEQARLYAGRAAQRAAADGHPAIAWFGEGAVEAAFGDPARAERLLVDYAASPELEPREGWRVLLFRALAARRVDPARGAALARRAFAACAALGYPELPELHVPRLARLLAEQPEAPAPGAPGYAIRLLGGFSVRAGAEEVQVPAGRPATLIKRLAVARAPLPIPVVIDLLWPDADEATGRMRVRNLLHRLRAACGELVQRDGDALALVDAGVDAWAFDEAAGAALGAQGGARAGLARQALAHYGGELLPDEQYEAFATAPRDRLRRRYLELLDVLAADARERGDLDEAIRLLDRAIEAEPLDETRSLTCGELLLQQGRRGSARLVVQRAAALRDQLGLRPSPRAERLLAATGPGLSR